jgi:hypothetical protein
MKCPSHDNWLSAIKTKHHGCNGGMLHTDRYLVQSTYLFASILFYTSKTGLQ